MPDIDGISEKLGQFGEGIKSLQRQAELASLQRDEMIRRLENIEGVSGRVTELERRASSAERAITVHEKWRQQGIGVRNFLALISGLVGASLAVAAQYILDHLSGHR